MDEDAINKGEYMAENFPHVAACYHMVPAHACSTVKLNADEPDTYWSYYWQGNRITNFASNSWFRKMVNKALYRIAPSWKGKTSYYHGVHQIRGRFPTADRRSFISETTGTDVAMTGDGVIF